jgi:translation initiation factor eIF-2B subunit delta
MRQNRISGAAEIERKAVDYVKEYLGKQDLFGKCYSLLSTYPSMASMWNIANFSFLYGKEAEEIFSKMIKANEKVIEHGSGIIKDGSTILTYSRSSTVVKILKACKNIRVICSESRPGYEGRKLAGELSNDGIEVVFATDASLFSFLDEADMIIMGADAILEKGIVNKAGTATLASCAGEAGKDVYVAASSYKSFPFVFFKEEGGEEVWKDVPEGVKIKNFYFDFTDIKSIDYFITENGVSKKKPVFNHKLSDEILKIKSMLQANEKYRLVE